MKKVLKGLFAVLAFTAIFVTAEVKAADNIGITAGVDYSSTYLWRGQYLYGDQQGWFFPYASYEVLNTGLTIGVKGELNAGWIGTNSEGRWEQGDVGLRRCNAFDFGIDYSYTAKNLFTVSAGVWYNMLRETFSSFAEGYISFELEMVPVVTPFVTVTADYLTGRKIGGDKYKDLNGSSSRTNLYIQAGLKKSVEVAKDVASVDFGVVAGYACYRAAGVALGMGPKINDISDIDFSVDTSLTYGLVTFTGGFHYVIVPGKQFKYGAPYGTVDVDDYYSGTVTPLPPDKDIHRFYATFGASVSI